MIKIPLFIVLLAVAYYVPVKLGYMSRGEGERHFLMLSSAYIVMTIVERCLDCLSR